MGEKRDSGSKDADNFGAEFGTDKRLEQRQAATRRNQAVQRTRSNAGDDRATGTSRGTVPTGGAAAPATLTAKNLNTTTAPAVNPPSISVPEAERLLLAQQNANRSMNIAEPTFEQEVQNLINSPNFNANADLPPSPLDALVNNEVRIFDESDPRGDLFLNPGLVQTPADIVNASIEQARANQGSGLTSLTGDPMTDANIAGFQDTVTSPLASGTTPTSEDIINQSIEEKRASGDFGLEFGNQGQQEQMQGIGNLISRTTPPTGLNTLNPFAQVGTRMAGNILNKINEGGEAIRDDSGMIVGVVHDGILGKVYTGRPGFNPFAPPERPDKDVSDPCPPGFQLVGGVCRPTYDVTAPAVPVAPTPGSNFQMTPTSGFPTSFAPATQATPVSLPDPFVLSPTGAAIGRRV